MAKIFNRFLKLFVYTICLYIGFCGISRAATCGVNEIDLGDGTCVETKFSVTTTNLSVGTEFRFYMSASGTFYIDCGDGGELSGIGVDGMLVERTDTTEALYTCTYSTAGIKTIRFAGTATGYNTSDTTAAISFYKVSGGTQDKIVSVYGDLSSMFPKLNASATGGQPRFYRVFSGTQITSIPGTLFFGYTTGATYMFYGAFANCASLVTISDGVFADITTGADSMFHSIFYGCTSLAAIPGDLFANITIGAASMFRSTFNRCSSLTSIPSELFSGVTTGANHMFAFTFYICTSLTSIPDGLFANITVVATDMFDSVFWGCTDLSGYIPPSMFAGLIANGAPTSTSAWTDTFGRTALNTTCPTGTTQYITGYENYWGGKVSCVAIEHVCDAGNYLPAHGYQCETCLTGNYCPGGTYNYSESISSGLMPCASGLYSPTGMWESAQCGRILHIGDNVMYLRSVKQTSPSLNIDIDNDGTPDYFGNMTTADVVMNRDTERKLKISFGGQTYSVYDDTVAVPE